MSRTGKRQPAFDQQKIRIEFNRGVHLHRQGHLSGARQVYQRLLGLTTNDPDLNHMLGLVEHQLGNHDQGISLIKNAVKLNPDHPLYHHNLGNIYLSVGRISEAHEALNKAIRLKPDYGDAFNTLGSLYMSAGKVDYALKAFHKAIDLEPGHSNAMFNLANAMLINGDYEQAVLWYRKLLTCNPGDSEAISKMAVALKGAGKREEAIRVLNDALNLQGKSVRICFQLAELYEGGSQLSEAMRCIDDVQVLQPDHPGARRMRAVLMRRHGQIREAIEQISGIPLAKLDALEAVKIHFEFGRLYDRIGKADHAYHHFSEANRLQAESPEAKQFDRRRYLDQVTEAKINCTSDWYASWSKTTSSPCDDTPVFLVAFPRSGTTLLDQILDSHPAVQVVEEQPLLAAVIRKIEQFESGYPGALPVLSVDDVEGLRRIYFEELDKYMRREPGALVVDKMPLNMVEIRLIHRLFPQAKIIMAVRHPYDVCLSNYMQHYNLNDAMANFLTLEDTARLYHEVFTLWERCMGVLHLQVYTVKYEDVVEDLEGQLKGIFSFLGLAWSDAVLEYYVHARKRSQIDTPSYQSVTEPIYRRARFRWKRYKDYIEPVRELLLPHVQRLGYEES